MDDAQLRRAVNATLMPGFDGPVLPAWLADELRDGLGSVCLFSSNVVDSDQLRDLTAAIHAKRPGALIAIDEEGGDVTRLHHRTGSPHPSMAYLGRVDDTALTQRTAAGIGAELREAGIDLNLAPVADVNSNPRNPVIGVRSFGAAPGLVARHVAAYIRGVQGAGVGAVAKHFPGHGDTATDSHRELPVSAVSVTTLHDRELAPFAAAVQAGSLAVMTSHILVPVIDDLMPATLSPDVLALLRNRLGFTGAIVSDALDMAGASAGRGLGEAAVLSLAAGVDLLCLGTDNSAHQLSAIRQSVFAAVSEGRLPAERVQDAADRVSALSRGVTELRANASLTVPVPPPLTAAGFLVAHPISAMHEPVLLRLDSPANIAAGPTGWGLGPHLTAELAERLPGSTCAIAHDLGELGELLTAFAGRQLVVQGRDLTRVPFLLSAAGFVRRHRPDAVLVELGWPDQAAPAQADVVTFGAGRGTMLALIDLLAGGSR